MARRSVLDMDAATVYGLLVQKAEKKGKTREQVDALACWLLGYTPKELRARLEHGATYGELFREAPKINPKSSEITGLICGVRVEEIEDPLMRAVRCLDKMVDQLAKGKAVEKILPGGDAPAAERV